MYALCSKKVDFTNNMKHQRQVIALAGKEEISPQLLRLD